MILFKTSEQECQNIVQWNKRYIWLFLGLCIINTENKSTFHSLKGTNIALILKQIILYLKQVTKLIKHYKIQYSQQYFICKRSLRIVRLPGSWIEADIRVITTQSIWTGVLGYYLTNSQASSQKFAKARAALPYDIWKRLSNQAPRFEKTVENSKEMFYLWKFTPMLFDNQRKSGRVWKHDT